MSTDSGEEVVERVAACELTMQEGQRKAVPIAVE